RVHVEVIHRPEARAHTFLPCRRSRGGGSLSHFGDRKCAAHGGSSLDLAVDVEPASVRGDEMLDDGQAEAGPAQLARTGLVHAVETLGDPWQISSRNAGAGVLDRDDDAPTFGGTRVDRYSSAARRVLDRVVDEVDQDLSQAIAIGLHG